MEQAVTESAATSLEVKDTSNQTTRGAIHLAEGRK